MSEQQGTGAAAALAFKALVHKHFNRLVTEGCEAVDAAVKALALAQEETKAQAKEEEARVQRSRRMGLAASKYGPLCLDLAGPFQSICIVGELRPGKPLLVLDIDHTIYDPSSHEGSKGSVVSASSNGLFDESFMARCRPGLHEFLTNVYKAYDIMVWSASDMFRILTLLQQLGIVGGGHSDYRIVAVLDVDSMSEVTPAAPAEPSAPSGGPCTEGAVVQTVVVPEGAVSGQQIEVRSIRDGAPMVVIVPPGLKVGDEFHVTIPGVVSGMSEELGIDAADVQLALQMSMGHVPRPDQPGAASPAMPMPKARKKGNRVKALSLIWACSEFSPYYSEKNTVIVDDTVDICSVNPHNAIQCSRYFLKDHESDAELPRLARYLLRIAALPEFPTAHTRWRDAVAD